MLDRLARTPDDQLRTAPATGGLPVAAAEGAAVGTAAIVADLTATAAAAGAHMCRIACGTVILSCAWSTRGLAYIMRLAIRSISWCRHASRSVHVLVHAAIMFRRYALTQYMMIVLCASQMSPASRGMTPPPLQQAHTEAAPLNLRPRRTSRLCQQPRRCPTSLSQRCRQNRNGSRPWRRQMRPSRTRRLSSHSLCRRQARLDPPCRRHRNSKLVSSSQCTGCQALWSTVSADQGHWSETHDIAQYLSCE